MRDLYQIIFAGLIILISTTERSQSEATVDLRLLSRRPSGFEVDFLLKNVGSQPVNIVRIDVNRDEYCHFKIWKKVNDRQCRNLPGTGNAVGAGTGVSMIFPTKTTRLSEAEVEDRLVKCGWELQESRYLGTDEENFKFQFQLFPDLENGHRCFKYRSVIVVTDDEVGAYEWKFDPDGNFIQ